MIAETEQFGEHYLSDHCSTTYNMGGVLGVIRVGWVQYANNFKVLESASLYRRYGLQALKRFHEEERVRDYLTGFILSGGTQQEPLSTLHEPSVLDPNNYSPGTILRFNILFHTFAPESTIRREWQEKDKSRFFTDYRFLDSNHLAKVYRPFAIVTRSFDGKENILAFCIEREDLIVDQKFPVRWTFGISRLGEWGHIGVYGFKIPFVPEEFYEENFVRTNTVEVLAVGEKVSEKVDIKVSKLSPAFSS